MFRKLVTRLINIRKSAIRHDKLKELMREINEMEEFSQETFLMFFNELSHSNLILAGMPEGYGRVKGIVFEIPEEGKYAMLFTDMNEFLKVFPDGNLSLCPNPFSTYLMALEDSDLAGYVINIQGEVFIIDKDITDAMNPLPEKPLSTARSYTTAELKRFRNSIDNSRLEEFINDSANMDKYEEMFDEISSSALLLMMMSVDDFTDIAKDGIISLESRPLVQPYICTDDGTYGAVFTTEDKFPNVESPFRRYSQIINFWEVADILMKVEADGIIINPDSENVLISRDVLLKHSRYIKKTCDDERLNSGMLNIFLMEE